MSATLTPKARAIIDQALELSESEREAIALRLMESIDTPPNTFPSKEALRAELQRRIEAIERGEMKTYSLEEAMAKIRKAREESES